MNKSVKTDFLAIFRTFWPVLLFVLGLGVWAIQKQTVANTDFIALEIRVTLLEDRILDKETILKMNQGLVRVETKIEQLSKTIIRLENQIFKKYGEKR